MDAKGNLTWSDHIIDTNLWEKKINIAPPDASDNFSSLMVSVATITINIDSNGVAAASQEKEKICKEKNSFSSFKDFQKPLT